MTDTTQTERPVLAAIATIMKEVGAVEKRGKNEFHRYDYATAADIAHALQKRMAEAGLVIVPYQKSMELLAGETIMAIDFAFEVAHVSGDRLDERPVFTGMAACKNTKGGFDDKAANKCLTAAVKYFTLNLFRIPTGDYQDADNDADVGPAQANAPKQAPKAAPKPQAVRQSPPADDPFTETPMATSFAVPETPGFLRLPTITNANRADVWRAFYKTFQTIIDTSESVTELSEWMGMNADSLKSLAAFNEQGADTLRDRAKKRMHFLSQAPGEQVA